MAIKELWADKYRPRRLDEYVFKDSHQKNQIEQWVKEGTIPHLLLSGSAGVGKTSLAKILIELLEIHHQDLLEINASRTNSVDDVRNKIIDHIGFIPYGKFKVILLDEADYLSLHAQAALRGVIDEYTEFVRFIFTCNYPHKIMNAIHSRCQGFHIDKVDQTEFTARIATILLNENISFELDNLDTYVKATYPDLRKCINTVQMNSINNVLSEVTTNNQNDSDYKIEMVKLFKNGKISDARKLICKQIRPEEIVDIYTWLYDNIEIFGDEEKQESAILLIKDALVDHSICIDPEINLSACMIRLARL